MNTFEHSLKKFSESKNLRNLLIVICALIIALVIFQAGILVGYRKAEFSATLGDNYYRAFEGRGSDPRGAVPSDHMFAMGMDIPGGHGAVGKIIQINLPTFIVEGPDNLEKVVRVTGDTDIRYDRENGTSTDLKIDDTVVVVGSPDENSEVDARLIRIVPPPVPAATTSTN